MKITTIYNETIENVKMIEVCWYKGVSFNTIIFEDGEKPKKSISIQQIKKIEND